MQEELDVVQAELEAHDRGVQSSREPTEIVNLERLHMEAMVIGLHGLREAQHDIALCGQHMSMAHHRHELDAPIERNAKLGWLIEEAFGEVGRHWRAMDEAVALQSMVDEERDHGRLMASLFSEMKADCDAMRSALGTSHRAAAMECPAYTRGLER
jgi:hypothetical protein